MITLNQNTRVKFEDFTHTYLLDGDIFLMGVTSLMKKHGLSANYSGVPEDKMEEAKKRGSKGHKDIEDYCNGKAVPMTKELKAFISCGVKPIANEYLISDNEIVASCIDIVADANCEDMVDLIDVKFTSVLHRESLTWQLSIYAHLFEMQNPHLKVRNLYGLHIRKNGRASFVQVARKDGSEIVELLRAEKENEPFFPKVEELPTPTKSMLSNLEEVTNEITLLKASLKEVEEMKKDIELDIVAEMEKNCLKTLENGPIKVTYVAPYTKAGIDAKRLQEAMPEVYDRYKKVTNIGASIKITIKKDE
jgi:hypothetical protein